MEARKLNRPNVGECQKVFDEHEVNDTNHAGTTTDLCAVILELEYQLTASRTQNAELVGALREAKKAIESLGDLDLGVTYTDSYPGDPPDGYRNKDALLHQIETALRSAGQQTNERGKTMSIPTKSKNPEGLHQKYHISKESGRPVDAGAEYFVLRLDSGGGDPKHIAACRKAVLVYADEIESHIPKLASDIRQRWGAEQQTGGDEL